MRLRLAAVTAFAALAAASPAAARPLPQAPNCPVFPSTNVWNKRVDRLPLAKNSGTIVNSIGADLRLHADFGSGLWDGEPIGIPITVVDSSTPLEDVAFDYADESDPGPYPIPPGLARYDEVASGVIDHALRFTVRKSRRAYVYPARHYASPYTCRCLPPMGLRLRLRLDYPLAGFP